MADLTQAHQPAIMPGLSNQDRAGRSPGEAVTRSSSPRRSIDAYLLIPIGLFLLILIGGFVLPLPNATSQSLADRLIPPIGVGGNWDHPFGTDGLGRDLLARIAAGAWTSLQVGALAASLAAIIGVAFGIASGVFGGWPERVLTLLSEVTLAIPSVVVGVVLTATLGQSLTNLIVILVLNGWIGYARVLRLQTRQIVRAEFILAASAIGGSRFHVSVRHILPNLAPTLIVLFFQQIGGMMLWEASLTFLGLGARPDTISLGGIVRDGQEQIFNGWWVSVFSGLTVALAILGFTFMGDWLRNRLDRGLGDHSGLS